MKDYYKILEVEENVSEDELKKSYRNLSKKYHPDVNPDGAEKFKEINEAYETLSDSTKRQNYDYKRKNPQQGGSFEDILSSMFGGNNPFAGQARKSVPDKVIRLQITPIESFIGSEKEIQYMRNVGCNSCKGTGGSQSVCSGCGGQGFHIKSFGTGFMVQQIRTICPTCHGQGRVITERCYLCGGKGTSQVVNNLRIKLPHGIDTGQFLKLQNLGDFKNEEIGDLILQIEVVSKDGYEKIKNDLVYSLFLDLDKITDDKYIIPHPHGDLSVEAPKIFDTSKPLRLRGKGYNGGDMYVKLHVRFQRPT